MFRALLVIPLALAAIAAPVSAQDDTFKASDYYGVWACNHGEAGKPNKELSAQFALVLLPGGTIAGTRVYADSSGTQGSGNLTGTWGGSDDGLWIKGNWSGEKAATPTAITFQGYSTTELFSTADPKDVTYCERKNTMPS